MEELKRIDHFTREAQARLPGFLYSFNIADLKRRNGHLGHEEGDNDIEELSYALSNFVSGTAVVSRVSGARWLLFSESDEAQRVQNLLDAYARTERTIAGWEIFAERNGKKKSDSLGVTTTISRAVRCLHAEVHSPGDLMHALGAIAANDYSLPVNRPLALAELATFERRPWHCVAEYPQENPACPFCGGQAFEWESGDGNVYSGDGACKRCSAEISIATLS